MCILNFLQLYGLSKSLWIIQVFMRAQRAIVQDPYKQFPLYFAAQKFSNKKQSNYHPPALSSICTRGNMIPTTLCCHLEKEAKNSKAK